jgi:arsenite methyltransferase
VTRVYSVEDAKEFLAGESEEAQRLAAQVDGKFVSGFVRATKPAAAQAAATAATPAAGAASGCCSGGRCC